MSEAATENKDLQDVQDRLMKMLDSVCLDPNAVPKDRPAPRKKQKDQGSKSHSANGARVKICPSCGSEEPWGSSSWCPSCGYYPQLKRKVFNEEIAENETDEEEEEELDIATMATMVPVWIYWLAGGVILLLVESLTIRCLFPQIEQRSPIAIIQILIGLNVLGIAHFRAYFIAAHENEDLNIISILWTPFVIWKGVFEQMPDVRRTLYSGTWGLCAILFAILFIGVDYVSVFVQADAPPRKPINPMKTVLQVAGKMASAAPATNHGPAPGNIEDALSDFAGSDTFDFILESQNVNDDPLAEAREGYDPKKSTTPDQQSNKEKPKEEEPPPEREIVWATAASDGIKREFDKEYLVVGYLTNSQGMLRSLLLAETLKSNGAIRFSGKYSISLKDNLFIEKLQSKLESYRSRYPVMKTPYIAKWTAPYVSVKIVHNGIAPDGRFTDGRILYYENKPPQ